VPAGPFDLIGQAGTAPILLRRTSVLLHVRKRSEPMCARFTGVPVL
jgi:hypothetical protein